MRLKKLRLSGFKSFVDPTNVPLPSNLIGVVGPNGCGKSNIIDAVRWVMGESSAKHLRGESLADVIFNGSSTRKPVGQATVELLFDNSDATLGGEYAQYSEIAIKRVVTRENQSNYYLNGTRCRRKDITDIFLGTGLGPRSYAIIEQGTISRLIEAKPEELRVYLEEAAGISKYKERRRETENRIRHTKDNLDRINDIREELGKQLERLQRQAKAAERYKELKSQEHLLKAQLLVLRWQALHQKLTEQDALIKEKSLLQESFVTEQRRLDTDIEKQREQQHESNRTFNEIQTQYYSLGNEIARLEEAIQHQREQQQRLQQDLSQTDADLAAANAVLAQDQAQIDTLEQGLETLAPEVASTTTQAEQAKQALSDAEQASQTWQQQWDEFNQTAAEASKLAHVEQAHLQHLEQQLQTLEQRVAKLHQEQSEQDTNPLQQDITHLEQQQTQVQAQQETAQEELAQINEQIQAKREQNKELALELDDSKSQLQHLQGRHASLEALQQAALGKNSGGASEWLAQQQLNNNPRLAQSLQVESGWERAVETVLGDYLQAVCVDNVADLATTLAGLEQGSLNLIEKHSSIASNPGNKGTSLASKVTTDVAAAKAMLTDVYVATDLSQGLTLATQLSAQESVITPEGIWLGNGWIRVAKTEDETAGVLQREQELASLKDQIAQQTTTARQLQTTLETSGEHLVDLEAERDDKQQQANQLQAEQSELAAQKQVKQARCQQIQQRLAAITTELAEQQSQQQTCQAEIETAKQAWQQALHTMEQDASTRQHLQTERETLQQNLSQAQQQAQRDQQRLHELQLQSEANKTQLTALQQNRERTQERLTSLDNRREGLRLALQKADTPEVDYAAELQTKLSQRSEVETTLTAARTAVEQLEQQLRDLETARSKADQEARAVQSRLEELRMQAQEVRVRCTTLEEQLSETEYTIEQVQQELPEEAAVDSWEAQLEQLTKRIQRLGAINLAAIDEYKAEAERKEYLDSQYEDLQEALETLENAIRKIDKETRMRFKETYDKVNQSFGELFPKLFGGGSAYLELTGEDLLDTGVAVMGRPPGKRNSSIHLLSGGEKAMTAVALVFAIFQLNPSPFCMLDEVDAPLDDANVGRFCSLVSEMSKHIQFIFITHNKVTMELADHLSGVTMNEPGVSRMVSVDVKAAVDLAEEQQTA